MNPSTTDQETTRESVLVQRMNIPRTQFKAWRESGALTEGEHWRREGTAFALTAAGEARVLELMAVPVEAVPAAPALVALRTVCPGVMVRVLRCRRVDTNEPASVRLTGPRVFARQFVRGVVIEAMPTETPGIFEYDGAAPRRMRI